MSDMIKENVYKWLNLQIKADKSMRKELVFDDNCTVSRCGVYTEREIQVCNLKKLVDLLEIENFRADWSGNKSNNTHYDIIWFVYNNYKFFELVSKE